MIHGEKQQKTEYAKKLFLGDNVDASFMTDSMRP